MRQDSMRLLSWEVYIPCLRHSLRKSAAAEHFARLQRSVNNKSSCLTRSRILVIYAFSCDCGAATYVGRTARSLRERSKEHIPRWLQRNLQGRCNSAITEHVLACDCDRSTLHSRFTILARCRSTLLLRITEALFIKRNAPNLCKQKENVLDLHLPW